MRCYMNIGDDILLSRALRKVDLISANVCLNPQEHAEFVSRFSTYV